MRKTLKTIKPLIFITLSVILTSCGATKGVHFADISTENNDIAGEYKNLQNEKNIIRLLDRKLSKDTIDIGKFYPKFNINRDENHLHFKIHRVNGTIIHRKYRYKEENGIYYLKNQNVKLLGIPFLFGSVNEKRLYLYKNKNGNLGISTYNAQLGAVLLVFGFTLESYWRTAEFEHLSLP